MKSSVSFFTNDYSEYLVLFHPYLFILWAHILSWKTIISFHIRKIIYFLILLIYFNFLQLGIEEGPPLSGREIWNLIILTELPFVVRFTERVKVRKSTFDLTAWCVLCCNGYLIHIVYIKTWPTYWIFSHFPVIPTLEDYGLKMFGFRLPLLCLWSGLINNLLLCLISVLNV